MLLLLFKPNFECINFDSRLISCFNIVVGVVAVFLIIWLSWGDENWWSCCCCCSVVQQQQQACASCPRCPFWCDRSIDWSIVEFLNLKFLINRSIVRSQSGLTRKSMNIFIPYQYCTFVQSVRNWSKLIVVHFIQNLRTRGGKIKLFWCLWLVNLLCTAVYAVSCLLYTVTLY